MCISIIRVQKTLCVQNFGTNQKKLGYYFATQIFII
jgi:hypothetical protein